MIDLITNNLIRGRDAEIPADKPVGDIDELSIATNTSKQLTQQYQAIAEDISSLLSSLSKEDIYSRDWLREVTQRWEQVDAACEHFGKTCGTLKHQEYSAVLEQIDPNMLPLKSSTLRGLVSLIANDKSVDASACFQSAIVLMKPEQAEPFANWIKEKVLPSFSEETQKTITELFEAAEEFVSRISNDTG